MSAPYGAVASGLPVVIDGSSVKVGLWTQPDSRNRSINDATMNLKALRRPPGDSHVALSANAFGSLPPAGQGSARTGDVAWSSK